MKTLVMTTIFVVTVVINAFGGNIQENFAYNEVMNGNQVESQIVYKVENGKFLQNHLNTISPMMPKGVRYRRRR